MELTQDIARQPASIAATATERPVPRVTHGHDAVLLLDESGMIQGFSESCRELFGYDGCDLSSLHISKLYPQLSGVSLFLEGQFNPMLDFLCHCGHLFQAESRQGDIVRSELSFIRIVNDGRRTLRLIVRPVKNELIAGVLSRIRRA